MSGRGVIVTRVRLADLEMDPANPRLHGDRNLAEIEASLRAHGQVEPLVVQRSRMRLIGGNGRVEVMKRLGWTEADANVIDCSDAEARALSVRLNRTADLAEWSAEGLAAAFDELKDSDWSFDSLGFSETEVQAFNAPGSASDVKWKEFDETIGDDATKGKTVKCPHCQETFKL